MQSGRRLVLTQLRQGVNSLWTDFNFVSEFIHSQSVRLHPALNLSNRCGPLRVHVAFCRRKEGAGPADQVVKPLVIQRFIAMWCLRSSVHQAFVMTSHGRWLWLGTRILPCSRRQRPEFGLQ